MSKSASAPSVTSRTSVNRRLALIAVLFIVSAAIAYPNPANWAIAKANSFLGVSIPQINLPFVLGLDLQGGTRLEYEADLSKIDASEQADAMEGIRDVIERRVNTIGVSEPLIQTAKAGDAWRISAELAGIRDVNQAVKLIGETPILEFKEQNEEPARAITAEEQAKMTADNASTTARANAALERAKQNPADFEKIVSETTQLEEAKANGGDLGFIKDKEAYADIFEALKTDAAGTVHATVIPTERYDIIAKVEETKDAGTEVNVSHILIQFAGATNAVSTSTKEAAKARIDQIRTEVTAENFAELAKKYSEEPGANESAGSLGWFSAGAMVESFEGPALALPKGQISDVVETPFGYHIIFKADERPLKDVRVRASFFKRVIESDIVPAAEPFKNTELTGKNLSRAQLDFDPQSGAAVVSLIFDGEGAKMFAEITKRNIGKPLAIYLDGEPISVPTVNAEITGGQAVISGTFTVQEAKLLAQRMNAGALPVPIHLVSQQTVGPTLGQASVEASVKAGVVGFILVALFMILIYRLPGLLSIVALALYAALTALIFKSLPVTMTLSGIAGFILSIGMAVDTNVLVYERLKEELNDIKRPLGLALEESFKRAWSSIWDGHVTILISCAVLYWFSSSIIRGFAVTLAIGTLLSLFTAFVVTRTLLRGAARTRLAKSDWLFLKKN
jgi:protein-export membrane protein SecD